VTQNIMITVILVSVFFLFGWDQHNGYALSAIVNFSSQFHRNVGSDVV
jgi:hypothetical protein